MELSCINDHLTPQPNWAILLLLSTLGLFTLLRTLIATFNWLYTSFLRPAKNLRKYGSWALVTGPTDGIGKGYAFELARRGLNLVLVGRNPTKLRSVSDSIRSKYKSTQIRTVELDFAAANEDLDAGINRIRRAIEGLEVGVLVNNVGMAYPYAKYFHEVGEELVRGLLRINVEATTKVTMAVVGKMVERGRGAVLNVGSGSGTVIPSDPLYSVYAASKAYVTQFSRSLYVEYKKMGIDVQCQVPLYVATKMASIRKPSFFAPSGDTYAKAGIRHIGYEPCCSPYWPHSLLWGLASCVPESAIDAWRLGSSLQVRKKGQIKEATKKKQ